MIVKLLITALLPFGTLLAQAPSTPAQPAPAVEPAPQQAQKQTPKKQVQDPKPATPGKTPGKKDPSKQDPKKPVGNPGKGREEEAEQRIERPAEDAPMPVGTDPADLAAMKSAEDMLRAERKLAKMIKEGKIKGLDKIVTFDELTSWPYEDGLKGMPKRVKELDGKRVLMTGFMLPIDEVQNIKEFLLVQSLWSCCYGTPPDINGIVRVVMPKGKTTDYFFDPLKIIGKFRVEAMFIDGYCVDVYNIEVESLEAIR